MFYSIIYYLYNWSKANKIIKVFGTRQTKVISVIIELINKTLSIITQKNYSECQFEITLKLLK